MNAVVIELNATNLPVLPIGEPVRLLSLSYYRDGAFTSWEEVYTTAIVEEVVSSDLEDVGLLNGVNAFEPCVGKVKLRVERLELGWVESQKLPAVKLF